MPKALFSRTWTGEYFSYSTWGIGGILIMLQNRLMQTGVSDKILEGMDNINLSWKRV